MPELTRRYIVMTMATEGPFDMKDPDAPFVLKPWKDPAALRALESYRDHCYPELSEELTAWIGEIASGPPIRGGIGARNEPHVAAKSRPGQRRGAAPRQQPKVRTKVVKRKARTQKRKGQGRRAR